MSREFSIEGEVSFKKGLKYFEVSGSKGEKKSLEKVLQKIQKKYGIDKKKSKEAFLLTMAAKGFCEDHMYDHDTEGTDFKSVVLEVTFHDKDSFEELCYDYIF